MGPLKKAPLSKENELLKYDLNKDYWTYKADGEQIIQFAENGIASEKGTPPKTIYEVFQAAVKKRGNKNALFVEPSQPLMDGKAPPALPMEKWEKWTYKEYFDECRSAAKAFIKLGHQQHDAVTPFGFNCPQWFISQYAAQFCGGKVAGIYPSDTSDQVQFKAYHSNASIAVVEGPNELRKFAAVINELPYLKALICWGHDNQDVNLTRKDGSVITVLTWAQLLEMGDKESDDALEERIKNVRPGHCCGLIYTSGTTGNPKAVMISHDNLISEAFSVMHAARKIFGNKVESERILSYLPLSHVAGMMIDIATGVLMAATKPGWMEVYFARPYDLKAGSLGDRLRAVKPTIFLGVPRVWEKIAEKMKAVGAKTVGTKKKLATWAKSRSLRYQLNMQVGGSGKKPMDLALANILLKKIKTALGLQFCKFAMTGAAPISYETQSYFGSLGININEVYGMSECTGACTWSVDECHEWGSVGFALPGQEVKIFRIDDKGNKTECPLVKNLKEMTENDQGEICYRGRNIMMGYLANPKLGDAHIAEMEKKNREAIDSDGWLHSGDKGCMSTKGMVRITGRYKELIIGAGGENIAPVPIEDNVKALCPAISNFVMIGDKRKFNVALVTLKAVGATGELSGGDELDNAVLPYVSEGVTTITQACKDQKLIKIITDAITATNKDGKVVPSNAAAIQKFTILPRDLSVENGDLTATLKLKRSVVEGKHLKQIDSMFEGNDTYVPYN